MDLLDSAVVAAHLAADLDCRILELPLVAGKFVAVLEAVVQVEEVAEHNHVACIVVGVVAAATDDHIAQSESGLEAAILADEVDRIGFVRIVFAMVEETRVDEVDRIGFGERRSALAELKLAEHYLAGDTGSAKIEFDLEGVRQDFLVIEIPLDCKMIATVTHDFQRMILVVTVEAVFDKRNYSG